MTQLCKFLSLLRRFHPLTYGVTLFTALCLVLIMIPGQDHYAPYKSRLSWWEQQCKDVSRQTQEKLDEARDSESPFLTTNLYEHGWPKPYLVRSTGVPAFGGYYQVASTPLLTSGKKNNGFLGPSLLADYVSWSNYDNWPFHSIEWRIHPLNLALDVLVFLALVGGIGVATERWLRSRGGLFRFRLIDLLAALTVCGLLFGWLAYHARLTRLEEQVASYGHLDRAPGDRRFSTSKKYSGPDWLERLVGDDDYLPYFYHISTASFHASKDWQESINQLVKLPRLESVHLDLPVPQEVITQLQKHTNVTALNLTANTAYSDWPLSAYYLAEDAPRLWADNIEVIAVLKPTIVTLRERMFLPEDVERLLAATPLEELRLRTTSLTRDEVLALRRRYPSTSIMASWGPNGPPSLDDETTRRVREKREE